MAETAKSEIGRNAVNIIEIVVSLMFCKRLQRDKLFDILR
jgi:hypothetical protein